MRKHPLDFVSGVFAAKKEPTEYRSAESPTVEQVIQERLARWRSTWEIQSRGRAALSYPPVKRALRVLSTTVASVWVKTLHVRNAEGEVVHRRTLDQAVKVLTTYADRTGLPSWRLIVDTVHDAAIGGTGIHNPIFAPGEPSRMVAVKRLTPPPEARYRQQLGRLWTSYTEDPESSRETPFSLDEVILIPWDISDLGRDRSIFSDSPLDALRDETALGLACRKYVTDYFRSGVKSRVILQQLPNAVEGQRLGDADRKLVEKMVDNFMESYGPLNLIGTGATATLIRENATDSQLLDNRKYQERQTSGALGVPLSYIGEVDSEAAADPTNLASQLWSEGCAPIADSLTEAYSAFFARRGILNRGEKFRVDPLPFLLGTPAAKAAYLAATYHNTGSARIHLRDETRRAIGDPKLTEEEVRELEEQNTSAMPPQLAPGDPPPDPNAPGDEDDEEDDDPEENSPPQE